MTRIPAQKPITAHTTLVGLIGWPVGHSVSPAMHNTAFAALELDWRYLPFPVSPEPENRIGEAVRGLRALGMCGANVTVPHKQAVIPFLDRLTPAARAIGAVNTIVVQEDGTLHGDNTDARGLVADLSAHSIVVDAANVLVLGAGGSARAAAYGLAEAGAKSVTIVNRTASRAVELAQAMSAHFSQTEWVSGPSTDENMLSNTDLILNCTSVGMAPNADAMPWSEDLPIRSDQTVYDLVYNPTPTKFVEYADRQGARAVNGKGMLVWQGAIAFELWTGVSAPVEVMQRAIGMR